MKDKEKQIEEMAKIIENGCADIECTEKCKYRKEDPYLCYSKLCAEKIYNLFYPKDSVVIPNKITEETSAEDLIKIAKYNDKIRKQSSKETAEKFVVKIENGIDKLDIILHEDNDEQYVYINQLLEFVDEIAKQFGVEIKEKGYEISFNQYSTEMG